MKIGRFMLASKRRKKEKEGDYLSSTSLHFHIARSAGMIGLSVCESNENSGGGMIYRTKS